MEVVVDGSIFQTQRNGGISRLFTELLPRMCELDEYLSVQLLTTGGIRQQVPKHKNISHLSAERLELYLRPWRLWKPYLPAAKRIYLRQKVGDSKRKIWHSTYYTMPVKWAGTIVVTVYDLIHERFPNSSSNSENTILRKQISLKQADRVICISNTTLTDLISFYHVQACQAQVIHPGYNKFFCVLPDNQIESVLPGDHPFFLYIGSRSPYKSFQDLIQAYSICDSREEVDLIVVGPPWTSEERELLEKHRIKDKVHLYQGVSDGDLCLLYNQALAFVYPSLYEGFGIPLLESMACGCPIVASEIPSTIEVAGDIPIYFQPGQSEDLRRALDQVLIEGRELKRIELGLQRVKAFSWDKAARKTLEVYKSLI